MTRQHSISFALASLLGSGCYVGAPDEDRPPDRLLETAWRGEEGGDVDTPPSTTEEILEETSHETPPPSYEFVGYVRLPGVPFIHEAEPFETPNDALSAFGVEAGDPDQGLSDPPIEADKHDLARGLALSADGRLFIEREEAFRARLEALPNAPKSGASFLPWEDGPPNYDDDVDPSDKEDDRGLRGGIHGPDSRKFVASSEAYPFRAVGVQVLKYDGGDYFYGSDLSRRGSGTMISPRALATNAHVFIDTDGELLPAVAAPGAKSRQFSTAPVPDHGIESNSKWPFGGRRVQWYYWPLGFEHDNARYDYGVLVLYDLPWSPGYIRVGHQSTTWLDYRAFNMFGYPGHINHCADSPYDNGKCEGAQYKVYGDVRSVFPNHAYTWLDTQPGQSGSGIYFKRDSDRVLYLINAGECSGALDCGIAKRLTAGSRGSICNWMEAWPSNYFANPSC